MRASSLLTAAVIVLVNVGIWTMVNRPEHPSSTFAGQISGMSFSPYQRGQDANAGKHPSAADIDRDLKLLADANVQSVRTYTSLDGIERTAGLAREYGIKVMAGAWLGSKEEINKAEVENLVREARANRNIDRLIVGNEAILRGEQSVQQIIDEIKAVRKQVRRPISTAEPWHVWHDHPELVKEVDFLAVQLLPYWEGIPVDQAVRYVLKRYYDLKIAYPGKKIILSEVGWPSEGKTRQGAEASIVNQARFIREFLAAAKEHGIEYFVMEAFDQPWKMSFEGTAGGYWGIYDVDRNPKFSLSGPVEEQPFWPWLAGVSSILGLIAMMAFLPRYNHVSLAGRATFSVVLQIVASGSVWMAVAIFYQYLTPLQATVLGILTACQIILGVTIISETFQFIELLWARLRRKISPVAEAAALPADTRRPKVSLHLPIHNEPPQMVMRTLDSLAKLDYPDYEVIVIDNNTKNPDVWRPVEAYCANLGPNFKFFHLDPWPGFKAGALNFALTQTDPAAEVVGVIDSDYMVRADWLKSLVPYFADAKVGWVQAPQDHREWQDHPFKTMINWEYAGFFHIGMVHRNERNAIIQHGTMTLIRKSALVECGNWGEHTICEDAELGLRLLERGYESLYTTEIFGQGLTPDDFAGYKKQRYRWVFGAVQIIRSHFRQLFLPNFMQTDGSKLTFAQRYHFIAGWLPWFADLMHLFFTVGALFWTIGVIAFPKYIEFPLAIFMVPALSVMGMKFLSSLWLYQVKVPCTVGQRLGAALAAMALSYTVARGILSGLFITSAPFMRTPKMENRPALIGGLMMAWQEGLLFLGAIVAASATAIAYGRWNTEANLWIFMLLVQTIPYASAVALSLIAALPARRREIATEAAPAAEQAQA